ncbi:MAG: hypothetical protein JNM56_11135 [Planctomycetia bacterium]|nr:hypothetical protein [Planctomycetia bacterium]
MNILSLVRICAEGTRTLVELLIFRPLLGLSEMLYGVAQAVPHLLRATGKAIVEAVSSHLSPNARLDVQEGAGRVVLGAKLLAAPVALAAFVWIFLHPSIIYAGWLASMVVLIGAVAR